MFPPCCVHNGAVHSGMYRLTSLPDGIYSRRLNYLKSSFVARRMDGHEPATTAYPVLLRTRPCRGAPGTIRRKSGARSADLLESGDPLLPSESSLSPLSSPSREIRSERESREGTTKLSRNRRAREIWRFDNFLETAVRDG